RRLRLAVGEGDAQPRRHQQREAVDPEHRLLLAEELAEARQEQLRQGVPAVHEGLAACGLARTRSNQPSRARREPSGSGSTSSVWGAPGYSMTSLSGVAKRAT